MKSSLVQIFGWLGLLLASVLGSSPQLSTVPAVFRQEPQDVFDISSDLPNKKIHQCTPSILSRIKLSFRYMFLADEYSDHPAFSHHRLRLKEPELCDSTVQQYSGYIDVDTDKHLFFWFIISDVQIRVV